MREELLKEYAEEALKNGPHRFIRPDDKIFYMDGFKDGYNQNMGMLVGTTHLASLFRQRANLIIGARSILITLYMITSMITRRTKNEQRRST